MAMMDHRLRMLLETNEQALDEGNLTSQMLNKLLLETMAYKEPIASDIRMALGDMNVENTSSEEIKIRLRQVQRLLNLNADYE